VNHKYVGERRELALSEQCVNCDTESSVENLLCSKNIFLAARALILQLFLRGRDVQALLQWDLFVRHLAVQISADFARWDWYAESVLFISAVAHTVAQATLQPLLDFEREHPCRIAMLL